MTPVPEDIWRHVAQFLERKDLCEMIGVNGALFHLAMDARYRSISLRDFSDAKMKQLRRLKDPTIAPRVHYLNVYPFHDPGFPFDPEGVAYSASLEDVVQLMTETVSFFSNVTHFSINWSFDNDTSKEQLFFPFITMAWRTFGSGLLKFAFNADHRALPTLLSTAGILPVLQELDIMINSSWGQKCVLDPTVASKFISEAVPTLQNLTFSSYTALDHSVLFSSLEKIPNLEKLAVWMEFDMCGLSNPRGLTRILHDHAATLLHVDLSSNRHGNAGFNTLANMLEPSLRSDLPAESKQIFTKWMEDNQSDKSILSNLLTFEIEIPPGALAFELTMEYIRRSADTLTSLSTFGASLHHDQVNTILSTFVHRPPGKRLESLQLYVEFLLPELVLMLATMLPGLHKLTLRARQFASSLHEIPDAPADAQKFAAALRKCDIRTWQLYDLDIASLARMETPMGLFIECVPSIRVFSGVDLQGLPFTHFVG